jgi:hypothetical protein
MTKQDPNRAMTEAIARLLGPMLPEFVFVGGCATGLLMTDPASAPARVTRDVDLIVEVASYWEYSELGERLRLIGLQEDTSEGAPLCRWKLGDIVLDLMPTSGSILGFTNRWYPLAVREPAALELAPGVEIRIVRGPLFLATKMEAFHGRGRKDFAGSSDLEDVIALLDGRAELGGEVAEAPPSIREYLTAEFAELLRSEEFLSALHGHFLPDAVSQKRVEMVVQRMNAITARA